MKSKIFSIYLIVILIGASFLSILPKHASQSNISKQLLHSAEKNQRNLQKKESAAATPAKPKNRHYKLLRPVPLLKITGNPAWDEYLVAVIFVVMGIPLCLLGLKSFKIFVVPIGFCCGVIIGELLRDAITEDNELTTSEKWLWIIIVL